MPLEIAYALEPSRTEEIAYHIRLFEVERDPKTEGLKVLPSTRYLYESTLKSIAGNRDRTALLALIKEESSFIQKEKGAVSRETQAFNKIRVSKKRGEELLEEIATTGKLFFNGKPLLFDRLTPAELFLLFSEQDQKILMKGKILWSSKEIDFSELDLVLLLEHVWGLKGMLLKPLANHKKKWLSPAWIKPLISHHSISLSKEETREYFEAQDEDSPRMVKGGEISLEEKPPECLPFLQLRDRTGAFADLYFDYGFGRTILSYSHEDYIRDEKGKKNLLRQKESEKGWERDLLETDFVKKIVGNSHYFCPLDKVSKSLAFLLDCGWTIFDYRGNRILRYANYEISIEESSQKNSLLLKGRVQFEGYQADVSEVVGAFNRRERFIQLGEGYTGLMPEQTLERELSFLEESEVVSGEVRLKKNRMGTLAELFSKQAPHSETLTTLKKAVEDFQGIQEVDLSPSFKGVLREYQRTGVNWIHFLYSQGFHGLLADDMGLGKTVQVIAFLTTLPKGLPHLIVVPTSLIFNWKLELTTFFPGCPVTVHHGLDRAKTIEELQSSTIILTSYGILRQDRALFHKMLFECAILDESHTIKNATSMTAQCAFQLQARFRLSLSGTPVENRLEELWSQFHFLMPDLLGEQAQFQADMAAGSADSRFRDNLRKKIRPFILRRTKEAVAKDLPEKIEQTMLVEMVPSQRTTYENFLSQARSGLLKKVGLEGVGEHRLEIFETLLRLRQIACHPALYHYQDLEEEAGSGKMDLLFTELETLKEEGKKVLIYSQFTSMLQLIAKELSSKGESFLVLDGSTQNRGQVVDQFQTDPEKLFFLISLKAGGVGLNLTAADTVILFEPWWNEAVENQAIDRAHRIGQKKVVVAKRYITLESIEEKMMKLKAVKKEMVDSLFSDSDSAPELTVEDLTYLLS